MGAARRLAREGRGVLDCALRELREETGIAPSDSDLPTRGESKARAAGTLPFVANNTQMDGVHSVTVFCYVKLKDARTEARVEEPDKGERVALVLARGARRAAALPSIKGVARDGRGAPRAQIRRRLPPSGDPPRPRTVSAPEPTSAPTRRSKAPHDGQRARTLHRCRRSTTTTSRA